MENIPGPSYFLERFTQITRKPHEFLSIQEDLAVDVKELIKEIYDFVKCEEKSVSKTALPKLIVENFDDEQIWQQLELQNNGFADKTVQQISQLSAKQDKLQFPLLLKCTGTKRHKKNENGLVGVDNLEGSDEVKIEDLSEDEDDSVDDDGDNVDDDGDINEEESGMENEDSLETKSEIAQKKVKLKPSVVDDNFFKLSELEVFLQNEDKNQDKPAKESLDLFNDIDDGPTDYKYSDFFENPGFETKVEDNEDKMEHGIGGESGDDQNIRKSGQKTDGEDEEISDTDDEENTDMENNEEKEKVDKKKVRFFLSESDKEESEDSVDELPVNHVNSAKPDKKSEKIKSSLEERQERLGKMIGKLEEEALSEKPWQLKGEVTGSVRPQNSLLEEAVDFDISVRPAPIMTEEVTMRLEDIIMQRIKDTAWDDVERKVKPVETPSEFKKKLALDQEKSKLSLAEVYEQEFIKQRDAATADDTEKQEIEPALHVEVRSMLNSLFNKLDALSNYHYTPRPVGPELRVISNTPAISMEEVAPVSVADAALLAPQEIKGKKRRGEPMSKEERTETDKKRARRLKKTRQRQRQREKKQVAKEVAKANPGLGNKYSKLKAVKQLLDSSPNVTKMEENKEKVAKSSTSFFNKLQDEVKSQIKNKTSQFTKKKEKMNITAKKLKL